MSASVEGKSHSTPSAPTPLWRSQIRLLNSCRSAGALAPCMIKKSFPQADALVKGTFILVSVQPGSGFQMRQGGCLAQAIHQFFVLVACAVNTEDQFFIFSSAAEVHRLHLFALVFQNGIYFSNQIVRGSCRDDHIIHRQW